MAVVAEFDLVRNLEPLNPNEGILASRCACILLIKSSLTPVFGFVYTLLLISVYAKNVSVFHSTFTRDNAVMESSFIVFTYQCCVFFVSLVYIYMLPSCCF
jgi:hypothetical protein